MTNVWPGFASNETEDAIDNSFDGNSCGNLTLTEVRSGYPSGETEAAITLTIAETTRMGRKSADVRWEAVTWAVHGVDLSELTCKDFFGVAPTPGIFLPGVGP